MSDEKKAHVPLPKNTPAFICANCGAVALDAKAVCNPQGRGTKADWCGTSSHLTPSYCRNKVNNDRYQCQNCGQVAINPGLLCNPEKIAQQE